MRKILLTGSSGFVGKNLLPLLSENYNICAPLRTELDLKDEKQVRQYLSDNRFDAVVQCANPNPVKNAQYDRQETMLEDSLRIFMNFYNTRDLYGKLIYFGSGAEYDKTRDIKFVTEEIVTESIPKDKYGLAKFYMNELARKSDNVYNIRLFGCYGPYDHESKFLTHVIRCCMNNEAITIRQDCFFDYMQVFDLAKVILYFIENDMKWHDYNVCSGKTIKLTEIAEIIKKQMNVSNEIEVLKEGFNKEYTACNKRLLEEAGDAIRFTDIEKGIGIQIKYEEQAMK